jgi:hypothetical protein
MLWSYRCFDHSLRPRAQDPADGRGDVIYLSVYRDDVIYIYLYRGDVIWIGGADTGKELRVAAVSDTGGGGSGGGGSGGGGSGCVHGRVLQRAREGPRPPGQRHIREREIDREGEG